MDQPTSKTCTKCREVKPLEAFTPGQGKYRCKAQCKDCLRKPRKREPLIYTSTHQECSQCRQFLPHEEFSLSSQRANGISGYCKMCHAAMKKSYAERHPDRIREAVAKWRAANPDYGKQARAIRRARKQAAYVVPFTADQLHRKALLWGDACWMCGTPGWSHWDHVKPLSKGGAHCLANLRPACISCNSRKHAKWLGPQWAYDLRFRESSPNLLASC